MACPKCGGLTWVIDEKTDIQGSCYECTPRSPDESRDLAAVAVCIATTLAAGNPSLGVVEAIAKSSLPQ